MIPTITSRYKGMMPQSLPHKNGGCVTALPFRIMRAQDNPSTRTHVVKPGDTLDRLARKEYGTSLLWFLIADNTADLGWPFDPEPGTTLLIPRRTVSAGGR